MTVILVDPRWPAVVALEAVGHLGGDVQYTADVPEQLVRSLPAARPAGTGAPAPTLLAADPAHPQVTSRLAAGEALIGAPDPRPGERVLDAVAVMDTLRTAGPWESTQTHESLRRYLLEETYELFDAVRGGDAAELCDELGDVLLQVLFHARIAEDAPEHPFSIDDVADALVRKLGNRVPAVLAGETITLEDQLAQWEQRKAREKTAGGCLEGIPTAQPALALAQKVIDRVGAAGLPADLISAELTAVSVSPGGDAENELRAAVLSFLDAVRAAERSLAADGPLAGPISADQWRRHWPRGD